ncbi:MAG: putative porin [Phycisphaerae bacterium]
MRVGFLLFLSIMFFFAVQGYADELGDLKEQLIKQQQMIEQQNQMLQKMMARIEHLETQQTQQVQQMDTKIAQAVEQKTFELPDSMKWVENIKWSGDLRYRHEQFDNTDAGNEKRRRDRIRARLRLDAKVNDEWDAIFRLATGSSDSPTSTNQTLGDSGSDGFSSKQIWLDWAYASWRPKSIAGLNVLMGKMGNPFYAVGKNQLIWDSDVSPEGIAAKYSFDLTEKDKVTITAGGFWLAERNNAADAGYFGFQGMIKHNFDKDTHLLGGLSYYDLGNVKSPSAAIAGVDFLGNTATPGNRYRYDYDMLEGFAEYGFKVGNMPLALFGNYINNLAAPSGKNTAWMLGTSINKASKPGSWEFSYNYRDVDSDAVFAGLCDSDFMLGGTDGKGHTFGFTYQLTKNLQAGVNYLMAQRYRNRDNLGTQKVDVIQADLVWKF